MAKIELSGWKPGLNTVQAIKIVREGARIPLNQALALVNGVLNNDVVVVDLANDQDVEGFVSQLNDLGLLADVVGSQKQCAP